ncbi:MAG: nitrate reductase subunit beta, partial [Mobilicoccus sp.]|nr:nitrate reductase subunit beta [Mobilicoccus sp.]
LPGMDDYYEPWTYDYDTLISAPLQEHTPVARPYSLITGKPMNISWSANWDDNLGGSAEILPEDPMLAKVAADVKMEFEKTFMFYVPRICEHCLNPSCAASCPSGAIYKREEDGIVLVDQDACRGWRQCITGCPYKKVYFNHRTGKAEKCTFCFPRIEVGIPTVCSETCVGRLRYIGLVLYDADRVLQAATEPDETKLYQAQRECFLDPHDPAVIDEALRAGIPQDWIEGAQKSPVWRLIHDYEVALPLHPEYRTMPMVWYIPPLSPIVDEVTRAADAGTDVESTDVLFAAIDAMRIPREYLAELFTAGDVDVIEGVLKKLAAMRSFMRDINLGRDPREDIPASVGMTGEDMYEMYRLLAIAKYEERYVIPSQHVEDAHRLEELATDCAVSEYGGGGSPFGADSGRGGPVPVAIQSRAEIAKRMQADQMGDPSKREEGLTQ